MHCEKEEQQVMQPATQEVYKEKSFGEWITSKMYEGIMLGTECAGRAGISPQAWSDYVSDRSQRKNGKPRRLHPDTLEKIAIGLNLQYSEVESAYRSFARFPAIKPEAVVPHKIQGELDLYNRLSSSMQAALKEMGDKIRDECR